MKKKKKDHAGSGPRMNSILSWGTRYVGAVDELRYKTAEQSPNIKGENGK